MRSFFSAGFSKRHTPWLFIIVKIKILLLVAFDLRMQAKEVAERKAREITNNVEQLTTELQREKHISNSAMDMAKKASKESASIKRAIQSLGCKVHLSNNGDCALDFSSFPRDTQQRVSPSPSKRNPDGNNGQFDEKSNLSVSISVMSDNDNPSGSVSRPCENLCPLRSREGNCNWPSAGCAQLGSQYIGFKANFEAFDKLSIHDTYFGSG